MIVPVNKIEYPESDGKPMGETDLHYEWMVRIKDILKQRYRGQRVYVGSDLLVYYMENQPARCVVPDDFVVLDCDPGRRRTFKVWEENRVPDVVFEVSSRSTSREDQLEKPGIYARMGVKEYFLYDPQGEYLRPSLQGFRRTADGITAIELTDGHLHCLTLGIDLWLNDEALVMADSRTNEILKTEAESECAEKERERAEKERERAAKERERAEKEIESAARQTERAAREAAEAQVRELQAELRRLKSHPGETQPENP